MGTRISYSGNEKIESLRAPFAADDTGQTSCQTSSLKKRFPSLTEKAVIQMTLSSTFRIDLRAHQRFPPISPLLHSEPSVYLLSHSFSASSSRRSIFDSPPSLAHTKT